MGAAAAGFPVIWSGNLDTGAPGLPFADEAFIPHKNYPTAFETEATQELPHLVFVGLYHFKQGPHLHRVSNLAPLKAHLNFFPVKAEAEAQLGQFHHDMTSAHRENSSPEKMAEISSMPSI
ncbi:MAG: hypothetical protein FJ128_14850 [Deltaproteobacteria bacterium]|nr:hypothetical protein [Deltaproteobacteria bacterium]